MLKYFKKLGFQAKVRLFILFLLVLLFSIAGVLVYFAEKKRILNTTAESSSPYLDDLYSIMELSANQHKTFDFNGESYRQLKPVFSSKKYFESSSVYLIQTDGKYLIHSSKEGNDGVGDNANQLMLKSTQNRGFYKYQNIDNKLHFQHFKYFEPYKAYIVLTYSQDVLLESLGRSRNILILLVFFSVTVAMIALYYLLRPTMNILRKLDHSLTTLSQGEVVKKIESEANDEFGKIIGSVNKLIDVFNQTAEFSVEIGKGNYYSDFQPLGDNDVLGNSMLTMRDSLIQAAEEEKKRKKEDEERNWVAMGLAKFSDILRTNYSSTKDLGEMVILNLVKYIDANQGGIFQLNDDKDTEKHLELIAAFAYDRKKYLTKKIMLGEGLVGACAIEKQTIYMTQVPQGYISITSGLGDADPDCLLIVPLKLEEKVYGIIELASFQKLEQYQIDFVEKVAESIASTISAVKINTRTTLLLQQSQQQAEEMAAQEEEMRQNMEELQATQEESSRRESELMNLIGSIDKHFLRSEFSREGTIIAGNELFMNSLGYSLAELKTKNFLSLIKTEIGEEFSLIWQSVCAGKDFHDLVSVITRSGDKIWLIISLSAVYDKDGELVKILSFAKNITGIKGSEIEMKEQVQHFEKLKDEWQKTLKEQKRK